MDVQVADRMALHDDWVSTGEPGQSYCPECGQSLDLARHVGVPTGQRTLESYVFAILGLFLVVVFGLNAWRAHRAMLDIDQQIADRLASIKVDAYRSLSDQKRAVAQAEGSFLTDRQTVQQTFDHDIVGLALGVVMTTVGVGTMIRQRRERPGPVDRSRHGLLVKVTLKLWNLGVSVTRPILWTVVMLWVGLTVGHIIQGELLTLDLMNRALERTVEVVVTTMTSALS